MNNRFLAILFCLITFHVCYCSGDPHGKYIEITGYGIDPEAAVPEGTGATYYLDMINGDDSNAGYEATPWKTIDKAVQVMLPGDTVILNDGNYGVFRDLPSVTRNDWITVKAAPGTNPSLNGINLSYRTRSVSYLRFYGINIINDINNFPDNLVIIKNASYVEIRNCYLRGQNKYQTDPAFHVSGSDHVLIYKNEATVMYRGLVIADSKALLISTNYLHLFGGGSGIAYGDGNENVIIERNHIYDTRWDPAEAGAPADPHASGISIRSNDVWIRENIIHNIGSSTGIMTYEKDAAGGEEVYSNIKIDNNLVYDIQNRTVLRFDYPGEELYVRNNTLVSHRRTGTTNGCYILGTAFDVVTKHIPGGYDGSGIHLYNNILIGASYFPRTVRSVNNLFSSYTCGDSNFLCTPPDSGSMVVTCDAATNPIDYFTGSFFNGTPDFDESHRQHIDYTLSATSDAVNMGDVKTQLTESLGSLNNGFIDNNGATRDAAQHSAGCYEN